MNAKGDANRSVRQTKQKLYRALTELLQQKPVQEITVRELAERAGVSRGTFYFHYTDIYALTEQFEQNHISQLAQFADALLPALDQGGVPASLAALFRYLDDNAAMCSALYGPYSDPAFTEKVKAMISERCIAYFAPDGGTPMQRYLLSFAVSGCIGSILAWQTEGRRIPPEEMARITWRGIHAVERLI